MPRKRNLTDEIVRRFKAASLLERRRFIMHILRIGSAEERHLILSTAELIPEDMPAHEVSAMIDEFIAEGKFGDN